MFHIERGGPRPTLTTTDANIEFVLVENTLVFKNWKRGILYLTWTKLHQADKVDRSWCVPFSVSDPDLHSSSDGVDGGALLNDQNPGLATNSIFFC